MWYLAMLLDMYCRPGLIILWGNISICADRPPLWDLTKRKSTIPGKNQGCNPSIRSTHFPHFQGPEMPVNIQQPRYPACRVFVISDYHNLASMCR